MEEIKFRGMTLNGQWVYGYLMKVPKNLLMSAGTIEKGVYISNEWGCAYAYKIRPETVGQFTGRYDSCTLGDIYEGDIVLKEVGVNYHSQYYPSFKDGTQRVTRVLVEYSPIYAGYPMLSEPADCNFEVTFLVIGNIHENPELLKEVE